MKKEIIDFIQSQRTCVLAIEMLDGSPHASTVHFAYDEKTDTFFFETNRAYRKYESLSGREITRASLVIGTDESNMKTLQLDGEVKLVKEGEEKKLFEEVYFSKFPNKKAKALDPELVFFSFKTTWWRFTDWTQPQGKVILTSS